MNDASNTLSTLQICLYLLDGLFLILGWLLANKYIELREEMKAMREKHEALSLKFLDYKLYVSDNYVTQNDLDKSLKPVFDTLKEVRDDVKELVRQNTNH